MGDYFFGNIYYYRVSLPHTTYMTEEFNLYTCFLICKWDQYLSTYHNYCRYKRYCIPHAYLIPKHSSTSTVTAAQTDHSLPLLDSAKWHLYKFLILSWAELTQNADIDEDNRTPIIHHHKKPCTNLFKRNINWNNLKFIYETCFPKLVNLKHFISSITTCKKKAFLSYYQ